MGDALRREGPNFTRYDLPGRLTVTDRGLYGLDIAAGDDATGRDEVHLSQEAELLLLEVLRNKYPQGADSRDVLLMHKGVRLADRPKAGS